MPDSKSDCNQRPRELRRRVVLTTRMRFGTGWSEACILNVSSRGVMIQASCKVPQGALIELRRDDQVIVGRVVWQDGMRAGLRVEDRLPVEDILVLSQAPSLQLTAAESIHRERRKVPRAHEASRHRARTMEFAGVAFVGISLSFAVLAMIEQAFARPLALIELALGG